MLVSNFLNMIFKKSNQRESQKGIMKKKKCDLSFFFF